MKWAAISVVLFVAMPAAAELMAFATWNGATPSGWPGSNNIGAGFDWLRINDPENPGQNATWCIDFMGYGDFPDITGGGTGGKWGGGLYDEPLADAGLYVYVNHAFGGAPARSLIDGQGAIEFWFKPDWSPATNTDAHAFIMASTPRDWDGLRMAVNGDGTARSQMYNQNAVDVGHDWDPSSMVQDWNHMAFVWDAAGNYTYLNGNKVGQTLYGPAGEVVGWGDWHLVMLGQEGNASGNFQSEGTWDSFGI